VRAALERLQAGDVDASGHVASLHAALLPDSPVARLGPRFLSRFYYRVLVADALLQCRVAYEDGVPVGFIAFTARPATFMSEGLRRHWLRLAAVLAWEALADPRRIVLMLWTARLMRGRASVPTPGEGELLSFGVLPEFRGMDYLRRTGRRIGAELFAAARGDLRDAGVERFRAVVATDNAPALMFYQAQGCRVDRDRETLPGTLVVVGSVVPDS